MEKTIDGIRYRHIIKPPGAYLQLHVFAREHGLQMIDQVKREPQSTVALQEVFVNSDKNVAIHYVEDGLSGFPWLQVTGLHPQSEFYSWLIAQNLPVYSEDELLAAWDTALSLEDKIDAILPFGLISEVRPPEPYRVRILKAMEDSSPEVRAAGLTAFSYAPWEEMRSLIEKARDEDPDDDVRNRAQLILDAWKSTASTPSS